MRSFVLRILLITLFTMQIVACAAPTVVPAPDLKSTDNTQLSKISLTDAMDRTVVFEKPPQRIAIVGQAVIMLADAVYQFPDASSRIVALSKTNQGLGDFIAVIDPTYKDKTILEVQTSVESVAATNPDAVILKTSMAEKLGKPLEDLGIKVIYLSLETPEQFKRDIATLGLLFQEEERAAEISAYYQDRVDRIQKTVAGLAEDQKPRVLLLYYNDRDGQVAFNVPPLQFIQTFMVQAGGGRTAWEDAQLGQGWTKVNFEQIAVWDPDQVYIVAYNKSAVEVVSQLLTDPQWQALHATQQGQLYAFPADYYSWDQADARWILGLMWLAGKMNPALFIDLEMEQEIKNFFKELYYQDESAYQKNIQPLLKGDLP
jgi:iron complex transport system substrate-binding protein